MTPYFRNLETTYNCKPSEDKQLKKNYETKSLS